MNANRIDEGCCATGIEAREPLYFRSCDRTLFGWLHHAPAGTGSDIGLVICKPFGYEAICSHRSARAFAESAAALGMPSLRFDYLGTGDSEDIEEDADQLHAWVQDVIAAVGELQRRTGVQRVCLLGFRLGSLLATLAATRCQAVCGLVLVAPVVKGRKYVSELRTTQLAGLLGVVDSAESTKTSGATHKSSAGSPIEVGGYSLSAATVAALSQVDLGALNAIAVREMLVIDRDDLPTARAWAEVLNKLGVRTQYEILPGCVEMMMRAPQSAIVPHAMVASMHDWLLRFQRAPSQLQADGGPKSERTSAIATTALLLPRSGGASLDAQLTERPVWFGSKSALFGIVTEPRSGELRRRVVILLNAGATHRIGASRIYVSLARRWAQRGYLVLRMDLSGLGDSDTPPTQSDDEVFPQAALDDIRDAIEFMRSRYGVRDVTLGGICSGAYHALRGAVAALPVNRILMVNPQNFFWDPDMNLDDLQLAEVIRNPGIYRERVRSATAWKRLLAGQVNIWRIVKIYFHRPLLALESVLRDLARVLHIRLPRDVGWELEQIDARGVRTIMVFARGEPGLDLLRLQGGLSIKRLRDRCRIRIIDSADHTFTRSEPRAILEEILSEELFARNDGQMPAVRASESTI